jgi:hypothetical protein
VSVSLAIVTGPVSSIGALEVAKGLTCQEGAIGIV